MVLITELNHERNENIRLRAEIERLQTALEQRSEAAMREAREIEREHTSSRGPLAQRIALALDRHAAAALREQDAKIADVEELRALIDQLEKVFVHGESGFVDYAKLISGMREVLRSISCK